MWDLIRENQRKSLFLLLGMAVCLSVLGYLIGQSFFPPDGGMTGLVIAMSVWGVLTLLAFSSGSDILLAVSRAKPVSHDVDSRLFNVTEEMALAANLPMPKLYILPEAAPNAFAVGMSPEKSAIAVTAGLLAIMNRDELQGVIAHEMAHILNRDSRFMTLAGICLGAITLLSEVYLRSLFYSSRYSSRRYRSRSSSGDGANVVMIVALVAAILSPVLAQLLYFAISRRREYLADATAARLTRYPEGLASALEKIAQSTEDLTVANKVTAPLYIVNPLKPKGKRPLNLTSTHPPLEERIRILRQLASGVSYRDYERAYRAVSHRREGLLPPSAQSHDERVSLRPPSEPKTTMPPEAFHRRVADLIRAAEGFTFVSCVCGASLKVPPDFPGQTLTCPHCHRHLTFS